MKTFISESENKILVGDIRIHLYKENVKIKTKHLTKLFMKSDIETTE